MPEPEAQEETNLTDTNGAPSSMDEDGNKEAEEGTPDPVETCSEEAPVAEEAGAGAEECVESH